MTPVDDRLWAEAGTALQALADNLETNGQQPVGQAVRGMLLLLRNLYKMERQH
jgi:hypothetical protein